MQEIIDWLNRNKIYDSACSELAERFGLITDEEGNDIDWHEVTQFLATFIDEEF